MGSKPLLSVSALLLGGVLLTGCQSQPRKDPGPWGGAGGPVMTKPPAPAWPTGPGAPVGTPPSTFTPTNVPPSTGGFPQTGMTNPNNGFKTGTLTGGSPSPGNFDMPPSPNPSPLGS